MFELQTAILPCIFNSGHVAFAGDFVVIHTPQGSFRGNISMITVDSIELSMNDSCSGLIPVSSIGSFEVISRCVYCVTSTL